MVVSRWDKFLHSVSTRSDRQGDFHSQYGVGPMAEGSIRVQCACSLVTFSALSGRLNLHPRSPEASSVLKWAAACDQLPSVGFPKYRVLKLSTSRCHLSSTASNSILPSLRRHNKAEGQLRSFIIGVLQQKGYGWVGVLLVI
jgi:hypothetical protein